MTGGQPKGCGAWITFIIEKNANPGDLQNARQAIYQGIQQCPQIGLSVQAASKFDQGGA